MSLPIPAAPRAYDPKTKATSMSFRVLNAARRRPMTPQVFTAIERSSGARGYWSLAMNWSWFPTASALSTPARCSCASSCAIVGAESPACRAISRTW